MGVKSPAVDTMIAALLRARERPDFVAAVRALDRVLISGSYVLPLFYLSEQWVSAPPSAIRRGPRRSAFSPTAGGCKNPRIDRYISVGYI